MSETAVGLGERLREVLPEGLVGRLCPFCRRHALRLRDHGEPWLIRRYGRVVARLEHPWFECLYCGQDGTLEHLWARVRQRRRAGLPPEARDWNRVIDKVVLRAWEAER